jgi:hypothetical protein
MAALRAAAVQLAGVPLPTTPAAKVAVGAGIAEASNTNKISKWNNRCRRIAKLLSIKKPLEKPLRIFYGRPG